MKVVETAIPDVLIIEPKVISATQPIGAALFMSLPPRSLRGLVLSPSSFGGEPRGQ